MFKNSKVDITGGPIVRSILLYAVPVMIGALIQVLFNAADLMVLGQLTEDETATAAVGSTASIVGLLVNSFIGLSAGVSVVLARCIGSRDDERTSSVMNTSVITSLLLGIAVMAVCFFASEPLLVATNCPEECVEDAILYLKIYSFGIPAIMVYNFGSAVIRTTGDTQKPLVYLIIAGVTNVLLNLILCILLERKVAAVAIATSVSQLLGAILVIIHLFKIDGPCKLRLQNITYSVKELIAILKIGVPCGLNNALFSLSNLQIQAAVNTYGPAATAGGAASSSIEGMIASFGSAFSASALPFVGQNIGAGNRERVKKSIIACSALSVIITLGISLLLYAFNDALLSLYLPNSPEAVEFGKSRMLFIVLPYAICMLYNVLVSVMQAFGYSLVPMINSIVTVLGFRLVWMEFIYPVLDAHNRTINNLYMCYTVSWTLCLIAHFITFTVIYSSYLRGKVKAV